MQMTNEEIVREYNAAASKSKQIKILADLNCVTSGEIKAILAQAGVDGVKMPERTRQRKPVQTPETGPGPRRSMSRSKLSWPPCRRMPPRRFGAVPGIF